MSTPTTSAPSSAGTTPLNPYVSQAHGFTLSRNTIFILVGAFCVFVLLSLTSAVARRRRQALGLPIERYRRPAPPVAEPPGFPVMHSVQLFKEGYGHVNRETLSWISISPVSSSIVTLTKASRPHSPQTNSAYVRGNPSLFSALSEVFRIPLSSGPGGDRGPSERPGASHKGTGEASFQPEKTPRRLVTSVLIAMPSADHPDRWKETCSHEGERQLPEILLGVNDERVFWEQDVMS